MALLLVTGQTLILVAGLALFGQLVVGAFNWRARQENLVYQLLGIVTRPVVRAVRFVTPRVILDRHVPIVAFLLLFFGYFAIGLAHRDVCLRDLHQAGCERWAESRGVAR